MVYAAHVRVVIVWVGQVGSCRRVETGRQYFEFLHRVGRRRVAHRLEASALASSQSGGIADAVVDAYLDVPPHQGAETRVTESNLVESGKQVPGLIKAVRVCLSRRFDTGSLVLHSYLDPDNTAPLGSVTRPTSVPRVS